MNKYVNLARCHDKLAESYGDALVSIVMKGDKASIVFASGVDEPTKAAMQAVVDGYDFDAPLPDPDGFVSAVAEATSNTGLLLVAQRLALVAKNNPQNLKQKFQDHAALPQAQKDTLIAAALAAGLALQ